MVSIQSKEIANQVSFGSGSKKAEKANEEQKTGSKLSPAKVLGALAVAGAATWGIIALAKKGKAAKLADKGNVANAVKEAEVKYDKVHRQLLRNEAIKMKEGEVAVNKALNDAKPRSKAHIAKQKEYNAINWDMKPLNAEEKAALIAENAVK